MSQQRGLGAQHPFLLTGWVVVIVGLVNLSAGWVHGALAVPTDVVELVGDAVLAILAIAVMTRMRWWHEVGFRRLRTLRDLRFFWIPLFPVLPALPVAVVALSTQVAAGDLERLGRWLAIAALVGFVEEVAFRGLILQALAPGGVRRAAVVSAVLFGLMHSVNPLFGADLAATLVQVGYATAMGFAFAAVALRTGTIWPIIGIHALIDVVSFVAADGTTANAVTGPDVLVAAVYVTIFTVYGVLVLRTVRVASDGSATFTARDRLGDHPQVHEESSIHRSTPSVEPDTGPEGLQKSSGSPVKSTASRGQAVEMTEVCDCTVHE